jgi:hypothetical protein
VVSTITLHDHPALTSPEHIHLPCDSTGAQPTIETSGAATVQVPIRQTPVSAATRHFRNAAPTSSVMNMATDNLVIPTETRNGAWLTKYRCVVVSFVASRFKSRRTLLTRARAAILSSSDGLSTLARPRCKLSIVNTKYTNAMPCLLVSPKPINPRGAKGLTVEIPISVGQLPE